MATGQGEPAFESFEDLLQFSERQGNARPQCYVDNDRMFRLIVEEEGYGNGPDDDGR